MLVINAPAAQKSAQNLGGESFFIVLSRVRIMHSAAPHAGTRASVLFNPQPNRPLPLKIEGVFNVTY